jgi:hypothetical protein
MHFRDFLSRLNVASQERKDTQEIAVVDVCILLGETTKPDACSSTTSLAEPSS